MPIGKITLSAIDQLEPNSTLWDPHLKGFGVRKNPKRKATFVLKTQVNRRQSWITIGRLGQPWTVETARKEALRLLGEAASGVNIADKHGTAKKGAEFAAVADEYLATHVSKLRARTREVYATIVQKHLKPHFKSYSFDQIERRQIAKLHASMAETPRNANHALAVLSSLMSWAEEHGYKTKESNPCLKIKKYREVKRKRYLTLEEVAALGSVIREAEEKGAHTPYTLAAIKLLLLTGARLTEILTLKWDYVDLYRGHFNLPDSKTGSKTIHLNQPAVDVLTKLPRLSGNPYVIVGLVEGQHLVNLQKPWRALRKQAGLEMCGSTTCGTPLRRSGSTTVPPWRWLGTFLVMPVLKPRLATATFLMRRPRRWHGGPVPSSGMPCPGRAAAKQAFAAWPTNER